MKKILIALALAFLLNACYVDEYVSAPPAPRYEYYYPQYYSPYYGYPGIYQNLYYYHPRPQVRPQYHHPAPPSRPAPPRPQATTPPASPRPQASPRPSSGSAGTHRPSNPPANTINYNKQRR